MLTGKARNTVIWMGWGSVLTTLAACGSLSTNGTTLPLPPNLGLEANVSTPQPTATKNPLVLTTALQSEFALKGTELTLLVQFKNNELTAQLPETEIARWISGGSDFPGIEGIDLSLSVGEYRETATAKLRLDQPASFTFSDSPEGLAELTATAFSGSHTVAQGQLSIDLTRQPSTPDTNVLILSDVRVPLLEGLQVEGVAPTIEKGTVRQPLPTSTAIVLTGQNLDQVSDVLLIHPPASQLTNGARQQVSAKIISQTPDQVTIQAPVTLALKTTTILAVNADGQGIGNFNVTWLPSRAVTDPTPTVPPTWVVGIVPILEGFNQLPEPLVQPAAVTLDAAGYLYIADQSRHQILRLSPAGQLEVWVGSGTAGFKDGKLTEAELNQPVSLVLDLQGNLWVTDKGNHSIRLITPAGEVTTMAGTGTPGFKDGEAAAAQFRDPTGLAMRADGTLFVADTGNHRIRQMSPTGTVITLAGSTRGARDDTGLRAQFNLPVDLALDDKNRVWVVDQGNHSIRQITPTGQVKTVVGGKAGFKDGALKEAQLNQPSAVAIDPAGTVWIADQQNHRIRTLNPILATLTTFAGNTAGGRNGPLNQAQLLEPIDVYLKPDGGLIVVEKGTSAIRQIAQVVDPQEIGKIP